jgi:two-component system phosphate regulon response regulator PhoB
LVSRTAGDIAKAIPQSHDNERERRVLIVESDDIALKPLQNSLSQAGFKVGTLNRAEDARSVIERDNPHLVMVNWDLPAVIAMDLVRFIRRDSSTKGPRLIAMSSFAGEQHVCSGLELGVDDYVVKPFSVPELVARVRAVLRSTERRHQETPLVEFRELQMDTSCGRLTVAEKLVALRNMEYRLLQYLMRAPERAFSREVLLQRVWGSNCRTGPRAVDVTVQRIRRALAASGCDAYLQTIRGMGYRLSADTGHYA